MTRLTDEQLADWECLAVDPFKPISTETLLRLIAEVRASRVREATMRDNWEFQQAMAQRLLAEQALTSRDRG